MSEGYNTNNYDNNEIQKVMKYTELMDNYKEGLCGLVDYVNTLNIIPLKMQMQLPFIKKYINDEENDMELLENGITHLFDNKDIILNFNFDNVVEFSKCYKQMQVQNKFIDMIDEFINVVKKNKSKISKDNIDIIKKIFKHIFDILHDIKIIFK